MNWREDLEAGDPSLAVVKRYATQNDASLDLHVNACSVSQCVNGKVKWAQGYMITSASTFTDALDYMPELIGESPEEAPEMLLATTPDSTASTTYAENAAEEKAQREEADMPSEDLNGAVNPPVAAVLDQGHGFSLPKKEDLQSSQSAGTTIDCEGDEIRAMETADEMLDGGAVSFDVEESDIDQKDSCQIVEMVTESSDRSEPELDESKVLFKAHEVRASSRPLLSGSITISHLSSLHKDKMKDHALIMNERVEMKRMMITTTTTTTMTTMTMTTTMTTMRTMTITTKMTITMTKVMTAAAAAATTEIMRKWKKETNE